MANNYLFSKYNSLLKDSQGNFILYNSRSNALLNIPEELYDILNKSTDYQNINNEELDLLIRYKVLVKEGEDQAYFQCKKMQENMHAYSPEALFLTIMPTIHCNFRCDYCFEKHKDKIYMSNETIDSLIHFINTYSDKTSLYLTWFGGEPLLAQKQMKTILYRIKNETSVKMSVHSIITNGFCLNKGAIQLFKEYPLHSMQVTIDGLQERHDRVRILKNGQGTFKIIIANLRRVLAELPDCQINIRVNINQKNKEEFYRVWNYFRENFQEYQNRIFVCPGIIKELDNKNKCWTCDTLLSKERSEFFYALNEKAESIVNFYPVMKMKGCIATQLNGFVIGPRGELYKCWNEVGEVDKAIGNIQEPSQINAEKYSKYMISGSCFESVKCKDCSIFPICSGGCPTERISNLHEGTHFELCSIYKDPLILARSLELHYIRKRKLNK